MGIVEARGGFLGVGPLVGVAALRRHHAVVRTAETRSMPAAWAVIVIATVAPFLEATPSRTTILVVPIATPRAAPAGTAAVGTRLGSR